VSGAFSEDYEVVLDVAVGQGAGEGALAPLPPPPTGSSPAVPVSRRQTFTTEFYLPFIETPRWGNMPGYEDDTVIHLAFSDPAKVASISAMLNGHAVSVRRYEYPRKPDWHSYYVELTGIASPGSVELSVEVEWQATGET
jgi:hypothetical protein